MKKELLRRKNLKDKLNSQEFYDLMQNYRIASISDQERVLKYFEEIKLFIINNSN